MSAFLYLAALVAALVGAVVYLDHRWASYQRDCDECLRREALDELVAEGTAEIHAAILDTPLSPAELLRRDALDAHWSTIPRLAPVAPVIPMQRRGGES